ncbi:hypothetical protein IGJ41_002720 [Enterococcus sp. DIV1537a]|nr:hypothetical protein WOC_02580 [Enterococcus faecalis EnGen0357]EOK35493.1 hypothetical protein WUG_03212 [Enterococcus faecalis EnGen0332]
MHKKVRNIFFLILIIALVIFMYIFTNQSKYYSPLIFYVSVPILSYFIGKDSK